jgi:rhodanese-related sulfurtransferase
MDDARARPRGETGNGGLAGGVTLILLAGVALGISYNWLGLRAKRPWGLPWVAQDRVAELAAAPAVRLPAGGAEGGAAPDPHYTSNSDPFAIAEDPVAADRLPEIPDIGRPVPIELQAFRRYVDAGAAVILDARDAEEYREGHVPGALNLPYDQAATDPAALERLGASGRPIITYCGGGQCEVSLSLAHELIGNGFTRVAVYMGGFPEWQEAGLPVQTGATPE